MFKRLESKYNSPVPDLDLLSIVVASSLIVQDYALAIAPPAMTNLISQKWDDWRSISTPYKLSMITVQSVIFSMGSFSKYRGHNRASSFICWWAVLFVLTFRPFPAVEDCTMSSMIEEMKSWWIILEAPREQIWCVSGIAALMSFLAHKGSRKYVLLIWLCAVMWLSNPGLGGELDKAAVVAVAKDPSQVLRAIPKRSMVSHDWGILTTVTWSKSAHHTWRFVFNTTLREMSFLLKSSPTSDSTGHR